MAKPKQLTIGLIVDDTIDKPDGVQQYVQIVGKWLSEQGHTVHYITGESYRSDIPNIHSMSRNLHVRFNGNSLSIPLWARKHRITQLFDSIDFDVLHVMSPHHPFMAQRVIAAAPRHVAVVSTFHILPNSRLVGVLTRLLRLLLLPSLRRIDKTVAVSAVARDFAARTQSIRARVVPNTIVTKQFLGAKSFPEYNGLSTIVFLNRLEVRKGCIHLLEAVNYIKRHQLYPGEFAVVVCGKGPMRPQLETYVAANDLQSTVRFAGYVSEEDKPRYIASADIAIYPSTGGESFGIVLLEAMAAARGVVLAGDNPGYRSVLADRPAQLFDPRDTPRLAALLVTYLEDSKLRSRAASWQKTAVLQYDIQTVGTQLVNIYQDALRRRSNVR